MSVPPLHQCILHTGIPGVAFERRDGKFDGIDNMKHSNRYKGCDVEPDGHIQMTFSSFDDGHEHVETKYHPDQGDGQVDGPFKFSIFLTGRHAEWNGDGCCNNDQLPAPEVNLSEQVTGHACFEQALNGIIITHENTVADECKNDGIGVQGPEPAE